MPSVYLSIGSNINRDKNIPSALETLRLRFGELTRSSVYETEAVGFTGPPFYNVVTHFTSDLVLHEIARILREIEVQHGRTRKSAKFSARSLDMDLLLYGDVVIKDDKFQIPRDDIMQYAFVLEPLAEIAPDQRHPITHQRYADLWDKYDKSGLQQKVIIPPWINPTA